MYLSQFLIDPRNRNMMKTLSDVYMLHGLVMSGFSEYSQPNRVLFRVEPGLSGQSVQILIQSHVKPSWKKEVGKGGIKTIQTKEFDIQFKEGFTFKFRLRANPVVKRDGKRYGLIRDDALHDWLKKKETSAGVSFSSVLCVDEGYIYGKRKKNGSEDSIKLKTARFEGILNVRDSNRFQEVFSNGIGPAKAFGCGMISLAKA